MKILVVGKLSKYRQGMVDAIVKHIPDAEIVYQELDKINGKSVDYMFYDEFCLHVNKQGAKAVAAAILKHSCEVYNEV